MLNLNLNLENLQDLDLSDINNWPTGLRWVAIGLITVGLLIGGYQFVVAPKYKELTKMEKEEKELRESFLIKKQVALNLPAYRAQMDEIRDRVDVVLKQLPQEADVSDLLVDLSQAGLSRGLKIEQFVPGQPRTEEFYEVMSISVTVIGGFHQLAEFLSDLASFPRIVTVGDMDIVRLGQGDGLLEMRAQLHTYQYIRGNNEGQGEGQG